MSHEILRNEVLEVIRDVVRDDKSLVRYVGETKIAVTFVQTNDATKAASNSSAVAQGDPAEDPCPYALIASIRERLEDFQTTISR